MELYASLYVLSNIVRDEEVKGKRTRIPAHLTPQVHQILRGFFLQAGISCDFKIFQAQEGRPCLDVGAGGQLGEAFADFNLSHSREALAVFVVCGSSSSFWLGCDIECLDSRKNRQEVAKRFFFQQEYDWIYRDGDSSQERRRFMMIWTAKEAWLKAHGLSVFDIGRAPIFSMEPEFQASSLQFRQFFLQSPGGKEYVLSLAAPFSLSFDDVQLQLAAGWRLSSCEHIYPAESPASTVTPKI